MASADSKKILPSVEDDPKIVAGALQGRKEIEMGLGTRYESAEELIAHLRKL